MDKIDAHQHFWQLGRFDYGWLDAPALAPIRRDFLPADLWQELQACGIRQSVFVQTQHNLEEARWVLQLAEQHPFLAGVVGWVDLASPSCEAQLEQLIPFRRFVGVRHITQDEPDDDFIVRPAVIRGLQVLERHQVPFDLLFFEKHLRHVPALVRQLPNLPMVIDHLAKPEIRSGRRPAWEADFRAAAKFPQIYCKLSGMITEARWHDWQVDQLRPFVELALEVFGPERLMYGSDWPVCCLAGSYSDVHQAVAELISGLSPSEQERIWSGTAREFYGLDPSPVPSADH
ncbi:MAG: amidohydrolase family protein [Pirellulales bacterium]